MNILEKIRLAEGVELIPIKEINDLPELKDLEYDIEDYVINKAQSRQRSKIISRDMALLLKHFEKPTTIVDAIIAYATPLGEDANQMLEDAHPFILDLVRHELLVFKWDKEKNDGIFKEGEDFEGYTIVKAIHKIEDTEVYEAFDSSAHETKVIIKLGIDLSEHRSVGVNFENEAAILQLLSGTINPKLIKQGTHEEHPYIILEKIDNVPLLEQAKRLRAKNSFRELTTLLRDIVAAYGQLHSENVYHIDINPRNVLINPGGKVFIIDFGLSAFTNNPYPRIPGADYFSPPEAIKMLGRDRKSSWSAASEQYCLGALLYYLYTGKHYINFSLEGDNMRKQLIENTPLPFSEQGLNAFEGLERILHKMLQKEPAVRYDSLSAVVSDLDALNIVDHPPVIKLPYPLEDPAIYGNLDDVISELSSERTMREFFNRGPAASIFNGGAGIAYFLYRLSLNEESAELISLADLWCNRTRSAMSEEWAFTNKELGFEEKDLERVSVFNHEPGIHFVQTLISSAIGDAATANAAIERLLMLSNIESTNLDMTMGKSSILLALAIILESLPSFFRFDKEALVRFGNQFLERIWSDKSMKTAISDDYVIKFTGVAHGWSGFIYAAIRWYRATGATPPDWIRQKLDEFYGVREEQNGVLLWRNKINTRYYHFMPGWCNGGAGFIELYTMAGNFYQHQEYLDIAERAAIDVYHSTSQVGDLCCGYGGRGYSLVSLYNKTGKAQYLDQAAEMLKRSESVTSFLKIDSLFKGKFGLKLLETELDNPLSATFPCM